MAEEQSTRGKCLASRGQCWASAFCSRFPRRRDTPSSAPVPTDAQALASSLPVTSLFKSGDAFFYGTWSMKLKVWETSHLLHTVWPRASVLLASPCGSGASSEGTGASGQRAAISYHVSVKDGVKMAISQVLSRQISSVCNAEQCTTGFSIWGINKAQKINDGKMVTMRLNFIKTMSVSFWFNTINI